MQLILVNPFFGLSAQRVVAGIREARASRSAFVAFDVRDIDGAIRLLEIPDGGHLAVAESDGVEQFRIVLEQL